MKKLDELGCPSWVRSEEGRTPVHVAAEQGWVALIDLLVRELRNKVDSRDAYQFTPLHSAANGGHVGTIQKLIHFQHDVDVRDYLGTPSRLPLPEHPACYLYMPLKQPATYTTSKAPLVHQPAWHLYNIQIPTCISDGTMDVCCMMPTTFCILSGPEADA